MALSQQDETQVMSKSAFGLAIAGQRGAELDTSRITLVTDKQKIVGAFVPYDVWFQIQHFVSSIIERREP